MALRRRSLPDGWYPEEAESIRALAASWTRVPGPPAASARDRAGPALAAVAPHAGWIFSGRIAALAVSSLAPLPKGATVAIFGGHLPPGARPLAARESSYETPLGPLGGVVVTGGMITAARAGDGVVPFGDGAAVGVAPGLGVEVGCGVEVGLGVAVGCGVGVGDPFGVTVSVAEPDEAAKLSSPA